METRLPTPKGGRAWALIALVATLIGLLNAGVVLTSELAERERGRAAESFVVELSGAYTMLALLPLLLPLMSRLPIRRDGWWKALPLHLGLSAVFGLTHTLLMWASRTLLFRLLGWGDFDYGLFGYRALMEYHKQLIAYALLYGALELAAFLKRTREKELRAARLEKELTEARLSALKAQLNPHFLFNTLNMISSYVHHEPAVADRMLGHLSDFLRLTLREGSRQEVPLGKELEFLESYLAIMRARFEERLAVTLEVEPGAGPALVPHLVLQPLVENAVKHCTADHERPGRIRVSAARAGDRLRLVVEDNGPGIEGDPAKGIGLSNTAERLDRLYGAAHRLVLENRAEGGLSLTLEVPFRTEAA